MNNKLLSNLDKIHTTELGLKRIKKNLSIECKDIIQWCVQKIKIADNITRIGKNWYAYVDDICFTVNAHSFTIITAHTKNQP